MLVKVKGSFPNEEKNIFVSFYLGVGFCSRSKSGKTETDMEV